MAFALDLFRSFISGKFFTKLRKSNKQSFRPGLLTLESRVTPAIIDISSPTVYTSTMIGASKDHNIESQEWVSSAIKAISLSQPACNIMNIAESDASTYPSLKSAKQLLQQKVQGFFSDPNTLEKLHGIFPGATAGAGDEWRTNAQGLINNILSNRYAIDVELLSNTEMAGAMGAFAGVGYNGKPVIYINADWLSLNPDSTFVSRVLAEEFGHSLDFSLNSTQDTAGDEGFKFALELFGIEGIDTSRLEADDHETLRVHGAEILVEEASVTFQAAYMGTPSAWSLEASSIKLTSKVNAILNGIKFISGDPNAQYFSGNNVAGSLVYSNSSGTVYTINGIISRQFKSGATTNAFYFYATGANGVVDSNGGDDSAYLLHVVGNSTTIVYDGTSNASYTTSSDPVDTALNNIKDSTQPSLTATTSSTAGALPAIEAGGTANSTAGQDGSGNVITGLYTNFTGTNPPTIISAGVTAASQTAVAALSTSTSNFTAIIANFGTLQIGANGTYLYKVDNTNTSVQGLRQLTDTLTDTFTYTAKDDNGYIASTTLTVTIQGKNDAPVASNDYATAKATLSSVPLADQYTSNDPYGMLATGNVLTNDSDVDKYGETKSVVGLTATATYANAYTPGGSTTKLVFSAASTLSNVSATSSQYVYISNGATPTPTYYLLKNSGTAITVSSNTKNADGTYSINLSKTPDNYTLGNGSVVMFSTTNTPDFTTNTSAKRSLQSLLLPPYNLQPSPSLLPMERFMWACLLLALIYHPGQLLRTLHLVAATSF
ncbi:MAG: hypothetical protein EBT92_14880 [Planctomycetes bacterium]|nr:hypothetical protein [Planctomycetota bacterium]